MNKFLVTLFCAVVLFLSCFAAMAIGLIVRGKKMRGGCGTKPSQCRKCSD